MNLRKWPAFDGDVQPRLFVHSFAIACCLLVSCFVPLAFDLVDPGKLIMGQATMHGVDVSKRVSMAYRLIAGGGLAVVLVYALLRQLESWRLIRFRRHTELLPLSVAVICLSFLRTMNYNCQTTLTLVFSLWWLRVLLVAIAGRWSRARLLQRADVFALSVAFSFLLFFAVLFLAGAKPFVAAHPVAIFLGLTTGVAALYLLMSRMGEDRVRRTTALLLPLVAVPPLSFLIVELLLWIKLTGGRFIRFRLIWMLVLLLLFAVNTGLVYRGRALRLRNMIAGAIAPSVIVGFALLAMYLPVMDESSEIFENANQAVPVMNVFQLGRIPLLDFMSSHMLSEQWYGYLYTLIFGYKPTTEFQLYAFLNHVVFLLILYWFLNRVFRRPLLSLLIVALFPRVAEVLFVAIFMAVVPFFFSRRLLERPRASVFLGVFLALSGIVLWRLDTGSAAIFASAVYFPLLWWATRTRFPLRPFLTGLVLFGTLLLGALLVAFLLRSPAIVFEDIRMALHYFSANQAHGYYQLMGEFAHQFFILHIAMPAAAIAACIYLLVQLRKRSPAAFGADHQLLAASLMLFLLYLANFQRGLVRHGYAESSEMFLTSTFFIAFGLLAAYVVKTKQPAARVAMLYGAVFSSFVLLKYFSLEIGSVAAESAIAHNAFHDLDHMLGRMEAGEFEGRLVRNADVSNAYRPVKSFLDTHLRPEQTFLDFSNSPMLYQYCERASPGYFCQNLQNTVDDYLQLALLRAVDTHTAPVVLFASHPRSWRDRVDDIPNAVRLYLIAEYIFTHYRPYGVLGHSSIWVSRNMKVSPAAVADSLLDIPESLNLGLLPEYTGSYYANAAHAQDLKTVRTWQPADSLRGEDVLQLALDSAILAEQHCYLSITLRDSPADFEPYQIEARFFDPALNQLAALQFDRRQGTSDTYMLRLSNMYFWHRNAALQLHLTHAKDIRQVSIIKDLRL